jgi:hypothetical protein
VEVAQPVEAPLAPELAVAAVQAALAAQPEPAHLRLLAVPEHRETPATPFQAAQAPRQRQHQVNRSARLPTSARQPRVRLREFPAAQGRLPRARQRRRLPHPRARRPAQPAWEVVNAANHPTPSGAWIRAGPQESSTIQRFHSTVEIGCALASAGQLASEGSWPLEMGKAPSAGTGLCEGSGSRLLLLPPQHFVSRRSIAKGSGDRF